MFGHVITGIKRNPLTSDVIHGVRKNDYVREQGCGFALSHKEYVMNISLCEGDYIEIGKRHFKIMTVKKIDETLYRYVVSEISVIDIPEQIYAAF